MISYLNKTVGDLMTPNPVTINPDSIMLDVAKLFDENSFHHLPVVDADGICQGVVSKLDYYQLQDGFTRLDGAESCKFQNDKFLKTILASEIMTKEPVTVDHEVLISDVIPIFIANTVHSCVVTKDQKTIGIITPLDLLEYMQQILMSYQKALV